MSISDWSSDVFSSDLKTAGLPSTRSSASRREPTGPAACRPHAMGGRRPEFPGIEGSIGLTPSEGRGVLLLPRYVEVLRKLSGEPGPGHQDRHSRLVCAPDGGARTPPGVHRYPAPLSSGTEIGTGSCRERCG